MDETKGSEGGSPSRVPRTGSQRNLEHEIAATYAEYFLLKHGHTLAEDFGAPAHETEGFALKAMETWRALAGVSDEDCSEDERILGHLRRAVAGLAGGGRLEPRSPR